MFARITPTIFVLLFSVNVLCAQEDEVYLTLADDNSFVVSADGIDLVGLDFQSASKSLRPAASSEATPFSLFLSNSPKSVVYGAAPGTSVQLHGSLKLGAGWDATGEQDIFLQYGKFGEVTPYPVTLHDGFYDGVVSPQLPSFFLDADRMLVPVNLDEAITSFTFTAQAGLLSGLELPADWNVISTTDTQITFTSDRGIAPADLGLLGVSWGASFDNAVYVSFTLESGAAFGPFPLSGTENIPEPTSLSLALASLVGLLRLRKRRG